MPTNNDDDDFEFSDYDTEDSTPILPREKSKQRESEPEEDFDFSHYDTDESVPVEEEQTLLGMIGEKLKEKFVPSREQQARQAQKHRSLVKGIASGLSFGYSEEIPGLEEQEGDTDFGGGKFMGMVAPIGAASKAVGAGIKVLTKGKILSKGLKYLEDLGHAFGTGAVYESGQQAVNAARGKETDLTEIPKKGLEFATVHKILQGAGNLYKRFTQIPPGAQSKIIEEGVIPKDLPKSQYETAEEALEYLNRNAGGEPPPPAPGGGPKAPNRTEGNTFRRVTPNGEDVGLRPTAGRENLENRVGNIFSQERFRNSADGGRALKNELMNMDEDVYRGVRELYDNAANANGQINEHHLQLAHNLRNRVLEIENIPSPSPVEQRMLTATNEILEAIAIRDEAGNIIGTRPANSQVLTRQAQSLRQYLDYDFSHGDANNIFRPIAQDIENSVLRAAENSGNAQAAEAITQARAGYRTWAEAFDNPYIKPFRDSTNQDFSKLYKSSQNVDDLNVLRNVLNTTEQGQRFSNALTRDFVDKNLSKYFENPRDVSIKDFDKAVRELQGVITPEQATQVREQFAEARRGIDRSVSPPKPTHIDEQSAKYVGKKPEDVQRMMNTRSGIKELKKDLSKSSVEKQLFERLSNQKLRSVLREGNIEKDFKGDELYKLLNKEKNYEIFSEILGEEETEALRLQAKEIGQKAVKSELRNKNLTKLGKKYAAYKTFETILNIL